MAKLVYLGFDIAGTGGISTYARYQVECLRESGHDVRVVSVDRISSPEMELPGVFHIQYAGKIATTLLLLRLLWKQGSDANLFVVNHVNLAFFAYLFKLALGIPYTLNVYNIDILKSLNWFYRRGMENAKFLLSDCLYTISRLPDFHSKIPETKLLYDPVDMDFLVPLDQSAARNGLIAQGLIPDVEGKFVLLTVAVMREGTNKGHRLVMEALAKMRDPEITYLVAGSGQLKPAIEEFSRAIGVADSVAFLGYVKNEKLSELYSAADLAVLVSRAGDGFGEGVPLGLLEAMSCGKPIVCGNQDGSPECIDVDNPNGISVESLDVDALISAIQRLKASSDLRRTMGRRGRELVEEKFSVHCMRRSMDSILLEMGHPALAPKG